MLVECPSGWCLGQIPLDLGAADQSAAQADYDGDGTSEPVSDELDGLAERRVTVGINAKGLVVLINDEDYVGTSADPVTTDPETPDPGAASDPGAEHDPETSGPATPSPASSPPAS